MKPFNQTFARLLAAILLLSASRSFSQTAEKGDVNLAINYFVRDNAVPYIVVKANTKISGKFQNVSGISISLFLDKDSVGTLIGKVLTDNRGEATAMIPLSVKKQWNTSKKHTFLAKFDGNKLFNQSKAEQTIAKAKILIDAKDKTVTATVFQMTDTAWTPVKGVDVILAIKRMDADLTINEKPTFTTDSTGKVSGEFKRDSIPGDAKGNITLVAKITDNDQYGNLSVEKRVPWGAKFTPVNTFDKRTLFATRNKAPIWLLLIAYSIAISVWIVLVTLLIDIFKIKKLGNEA